jgi:hypothetical protein
LIVAATTDPRPRRLPRRRKWKTTSTIVESRFHSARFFGPNPIRFLTLVARLGYDTTYSFGSDPSPFEPRKVRQPNPLTGRVGNGTALREDRGRGTLSMAPERARIGPEVEARRYDDERAETVMNLTPGRPMLLYVATGMRT